MQALKWIVLSLGLLLCPTVWAAEVLIALPNGPIEAGQMFEIPVYVTDGSVDLASYALRINYAPDTLRIVEITGGVFSGFHRTPVTDPAKFASGTTDFTAVNEGFIPTPDMFEVARIRMQAVGRPGDSSAVSLSISPNGGLVDSVQFALLETSLLGAGEVSILDDGSNDLPPNAPANLRARSKGTKVSLSWLGAEDADVYRMFRKLLGETAFTGIGETKNHAYVDNAPSGSGSASYYVIAENVYGASASSNTVAVDIFERSSPRGRRRR